MNRKVLMIAGLILSFLLVLYLSPLGSMIVSGYQMKWHKEHLRNGIDRLAVRDACIVLIKAQESKLAGTATQPEERSLRLPATDPSIPQVLRDLPARSIGITPTSVRIDCGGGGFDTHYGILYDVDPAAEQRQYNLKLTDHLYYWH